MIYIGIDPGVKTGVAVSSGGKLKEVKTMRIHQALALVLSYANEFGKHKITLVVEDPNTYVYRRGKSQASQAKAQGAGSVKRDFKIWEDFAADYGIGFVAKDVKTIRTKVKAPAFKSLTGWAERTSNHSRDAAMMVYGM